MIEGNGARNPLYTNRFREDELDAELKLFDFSHYPIPTNESNTLRLFYNNVNGLEINVAIQSILNNRNKKQSLKIINEVETFTKLEAFMKQMYTWEVDTVVMAEPCIEWRDAIPRNIVKEISKKYDKNGNWTVATSKCYSGSYVKPGGAAVYSSGSVVGKITGRGTDPWGYGRWSFVRYGGQDGTELIVIGGYRVGHRSTPAGASTAWHQQKVLLATDKREMEPEEAMLIDLEQWIGTVRSARSEIIVFLDANEKWGDHARITKFAHDNALSDLNTAGGYNFPPTHPCLQNSTRDTTIDFCLCTQRVVDNIAYATMAPYF